MISPSFHLRLTIARHRTALVEFASQGYLNEAFNRTIELLTVRILAGGKILICGNGGSAADAQHLAAEFVVRYHHDRNPIAAIALTTDSSIMTAAYNDGYSVFQRQVQALGKPGDVLIAISTSGKSQNVLEAIYAAKTLGIAIIGLTGMHGFRDMHQVQTNLGIDVELRVPSDSTNVVQELHMLIYHAIVEALEKELKLCESVECRI